nr:hypothetical protein B0A51_05600 [Rachicladosporium sp. CCFEE 5018]
MESTDARFGRSKELARSPEKAAVETALITSIQGLPPELFDMIENDTLQLKTTGPGVFRIDKSWRPPPLLQVNSATRIANAKRYYAIDVFDFSGVGTRAGSDLCVSWLRYLPDHSQAQIQRIRFKDNYKTRPSPLDCSTIWRHIQTTAREALTQFNPDTIDESISTDLWNWLFEQLANLGPIWQSISRTRLSGFVRERGGVYQYLVERTETKINFLGADGVEHETWIHTYPLTAQRELVAAVMKECGNGA